MALSFFRSLNPISENSGIQYALAHGDPIQGTEMLDHSVLQTIKKAYTLFRQDTSLLNALYNTSEIIMGNHFDLNMKRNGSKGLLDFLIFPLISRKLIADCFLAESSYASNILRLMIAIPLELCRILIAAAIMLAIVPVLTLIMCFRIFLQTILELMLLIGAISLIILSIPFILLIPFNRVTNPIRPEPELLLMTNVNENKIQKIIEENQITEESLNIPDEFKCPISLVIMDDPVFVITKMGETSIKHTFERASILNSLASDGKHPLTRQDLELNHLKDDVELKGKIEAFVGDIENTYSKPRP